MPDQPSPHRRFQFRLRTLLIGVTLLAVACWYVAREVNTARARGSMVDRIVNVEGGFVAHYLKFAPCPWIRRLLGDEPVDVVALPISSPLTDQEIHAVFPEAEVEHNYVEPTQFPLLSAAKP